ncbi:MAG: DUF2249 domain-containing protein [Halapricum sp.]
MSTDTSDRSERRLDVRGIEGEPFGDIVEALSDLEATETLLLVNSFEPVPLYDVLEQRGFTYESTQIDDDEWHVRIEHA